MSLLPVVRSGPRPGLGKMFANGGSRMLRLETLDVALSPAVGASAAPGRVTLPPRLVTQALGTMIAGRAEGQTGFAIEQLCAALIEDAPGRALAVIKRLLDCGVSIDAIYDTYIPRAAARLGDLWVDDRLGFTGVTLGMARLTEVFRSISPQYLRRQTDDPLAGKPFATAPAPRRALFALVPGEEHALGVVMAADRFQRAGWAVRVELRAEAADLARILRDRAFDVVGLSAGSRRMMPMVRETVGRLRDAARPGTLFVLGGPVVALDPCGGEACGVDIAGLSAADILVRVAGAERNV